MTATPPVLKQIAGLPKLSHGELKALWREYFGAEPPVYRRGFLIRGIAHRLQELAFRPLAPVYQARLDAMIEGTEKSNGAGRRGRRRLRAPGQALSEPLGGRPRDRRHPVVRAAVLWPAQDRERLMRPAQPKCRVAIYTRKSSEEGLTTQQFN